MTNRIAAVRQASSSGAVAATAGILEVRAIRSQAFHESPVRRGNVGGMGSELLLVIVVVTALAFDFTNGFHDTANAMATSIATGALRPRSRPGSSTRTC